MSGFGDLIGGLIPGLRKGLQKGIQYDIDFARLEIKAMETGNTAMQQDLNSVRQQFVREAADVMGVVRGDVLSTLMSGGDPFAGSRHMLQAVETKYGKP